MIGILPVNVFEAFVALECNIDARGKAYRLRIGIIAITMGIILAIFPFSYFVGFSIHWIIPAGVIFGGAFAIFEARAGWCVARAIGFRTPL